MAFPIVGIGASAGGFEACLQLLKALPEETGMAFVLVQHLDPGHKSELASLLQRATAMPVREVADRMRVRPNWVYVIPPGKCMTLSAGTLRLGPRPAGRQPAHAIDSFFESLARELRERAIGVILSGTATDGTHGLEAIKGEDGITFAQDHSAQHASMPRSAVAAGCVDFELSPQAIAEELVRISRHPFVTGGRRALRIKSDRAATPARKDDAAQPPFGGKGAPAAGYFKDVLLLVRARSGVDFSFYKPGTIQRRIIRRMVLSRLKTIEAYAAFLRGNAQELDALYSDLLIGVTSFFRNPEAFDFLRRTIFPALLAQGSEQPARMWVLGCSTGQEAYSLAMAFIEAGGLDSGSRPLQIFATDLNDNLLEKARAGLYSRNLARDVPAQRLRRFFVEEAGGYRVSKQVRDMVVFARQNVLTDPPFSRMDLVSCRNLLIYLAPELQKRILPMFHYALNPGGVLFLGASESVAGFSRLFEAVDKKHKVFVRKPGAPAMGFVPVAPLPSLMGRSVAHSRAPAPARAAQSELAVQREADRLMVSQFAPPGVLIGADLQILQFRGSTSPYLAPPAGKASFDVLKMARGGLMLPLRAAITAARKQGGVVRKEHVRLAEASGIRSVTLQVMPLKNGGDLCFLILFEDEKPRPGGRDAGAGAVRTGQREETPGRGHSTGETPPRARALQSELAQLRDYVRTVQQEYDAAQEEQQASNEEATSANEELQSINEELETSKEELESTNEELTTVNEEMVHRNAELNRFNADLNNLFLSVDTAILLLGRDLKIRRFTPLAEKLFNLQRSDAGRPLSAVRHPLEVAPDSGTGNSPAPPWVPLPLEDLVREVVDDVRPREREVRDHDGRWYSLRVRPYLSLDNKIDGAVLVLVDIDAVKRTESTLRAARDYAEATLHTARDPLVVLRADLRVNTANVAFYRAFLTTPADTEGRFIHELGTCQWDVARLRALFQEITLRNSSFDDYEVQADFPKIGRRTMLLNGRRLEFPDGSPAMILLAIQDVTERQRGEAAMATLAAIVNSSEDAIIGQDTDGIITHWNHAAERLFGYASEAAVGRPFDLLVPPDWHGVEAGIAGQDGKAGSANPFETVLARQDGSQIEVAVTVSPIEDSAGRVIGTSKIIRDVTARRRAERKMREADECLARELVSTKQLQFASARMIEGGRTEDLYGVIVDAATVIMRADRACIQMLDDNGDALREIVCQGNDPEFARAFGVSHRDSRTSAGLAMQTGSRVVVPDVEACEFITGTAALEDHRKNGVGAAQSTPLLSRDGQMLGMISTYWRAPHAPPIAALRLLDILARQAADLLERRRAEAALERARDEAVAASRAKDEFLAALSHELRTPLNPVLLLASDSAANASLPDEVRADFDTIRNNISLEARLIDDLLDVTRISRGKLRMEKTPCDAHIVIRDAIGVVRSDLVGKNVRLADELAACPAMVVADPVRLQQVFWNVLRNAVHFTPPGGLITVRSELDDPAAELTVTITDTGIGIAGEELEMIFEAFSQGKEAANAVRRAGGLGLGLAISRKLVEMHGGSIRASSSGRGLGSAFAIKLPLLAAPAALAAALTSVVVVEAAAQGGGTRREGASAANQPADAVPPPAGSRVLVVEDHASTLATLRGLLLRRGFDVFTAVSGAEALEAAKAHDIDLVISDIGLPEIDGHALMAQLRVARPLMQGIALSGYGFAVDVAKSEAAGYGEHLTKPIRIEDLDHALARLRDRTILTAGRDSGRGDRE